LIGPNLKNAAIRLVKNFRVELSSKYKNPSSEGQWLKKFKLPFSPSNEIGDIFCFELMASKPDNDILTLVTNYVEESSRFPPYLWSHVKSEQTRTTNVCESFHSHFNKVFILRTQIFMCL
jgi:hypothetical protein